MHALMQNSHKAIYLNYRKLYDKGNDSLPILIESITQHNWSKIENQKEIRVLSGVLTLINDIDENICQETANQLLKQDVTIAVKQCINSILSFSLEHYSSHIINNIPFYISKELNNQKILDKINKWISIVPHEDLKNLDRFYIIADNESYSYSGTYTPVLSFIRIVWHIDKNDNFLKQFISSLSTEKTFYHEIGHHKHDHTFGYDEKQEDEADEYSKIFMRKNHPILAAIVRTINMIRGKNKSKN